MGVYLDQPVRCERSPAEWLEWVLVSACLGALVLAVVAGLDLVAVIAALVASSHVPRLTIRYELTDTRLILRVLWMRQAVPLSRIIAVEPLSRSNASLHARVWTDYSLPLSKVLVVTVLDGEDKYGFRLSPSPEFAAALTDAWRASREPGSGSISSGSGPSGTSRGGLP